MLELTHVCPSCGAELPAGRSCRDVCDELYVYTLAQGGAEFIHQHMVDAYAAQHVGKDTKPIALTAALIGLFLFAERNYSGRQVQQMHMELGNRMKTWPLFEAPAEHAKLTVMEPLSVPAGTERDEKIRQWARAVWEIWRERHAEVETLLN